MNHKLLFSYKVNYALKYMHIRTYVRTHTLHIHTHRHTAMGPIMYVRVCICICHTTKYVRTYVCIPLVLRLRPLSKHLVSPRAVHPSCPAVKLPPHLVCVLAAPPSCGKPWFVLGEKKEQSLR